MARNFAGRNFLFRVMHFFHMDIFSVRSISRDLYRTATDECSAAGAGA
jgi:hypothetical protein